MLEHLFVIPSFIWEGYQHVLACCVFRQGMPILYLPEFFILPIFGRRSAISGPLLVVVRYRYLSRENLTNFVRHEKTHDVQWWREGLIIFLALVYVIEFIIYSIYYLDMDKGYASIAPEQEAYINQNDPDYLRHRKWFAWFKYLNPKNKKPVWEDDPDILLENFVEAHLKHLKMEEMYG